MDRLLGVLISLSQWIEMFVMKKTMVLYKDRISANWESCTVMYIV